MKNCTVNENFYGGGSLGKVTGNTTSVLDNCTVKGNVFGAGYSASKPKINVRSSGFSTLPKFNLGSGMFEPGVPTSFGDLSGTVEFEWTTHAFPANGSNAIDESGTPKYVWTNQTITNDNLGSVGSATLTLKGNTTVGTQGDNTTGNVYGGGDESIVTGNTTVILEGGAHVLGNVYGGGNRGAVSGNSSVKLQ